MKLLVRENNVNMFLEIGDGKVVVGEWSVGLE